MKSPASLNGIELYAWVGEDELGSGETGLKQGNTAAGCIALVSMDRGKVQKFYPQLEAQAARYGKKIRLCRFTFAEVVYQTEHGN